MTQTAEERRDSDDRPGPSDTPLTPAAALLEAYQLGYQQRILDETAGRKVTP